MRALLLFLLATAPFAPALAQSAPPDAVAAQVVQVAGENAYLSAGTDAGLATGDTLGVWTGDAFAGRLRVVAATRTQAVATWLGSPFPLTRGAQVTVAVMGESDEAPAVAETAPVAPPPTPDRASIFAQGGPRSAGRLAPAVQVTGRFQVGTTALRTTTDAPGGVADRTFALPFTSLRADVTGLPAGLTGRLHAYGSYRYATGSAFDQPADVRVYTASLERSTGWVDGAVGRLFEPAAPEAGYTDGARLRVGSESTGVGIVAGLQPDRAFGAPDARFPKALAFAETRTEWGDWRGEATVRAGHVAPQAGGLVGRTFAGGTARLRGRVAERPAAVTFDLVGEQDPAGGFALSRLYARGSFSPVTPLRLQARFRRTRPYVLLPGFQALLDETQQVGAGAALTVRPLARATLRADLSRTTSGRYDATALLLGLGVPRVPGLGVGVDVQATRQATDRGDATYASASLSRTFGPLWVQGGYRYTATPLGADLLVQHAAEATAQLPLGDRLALTVQASTGGGDGLQNTRLYTALWVRL